MSYTQEYLDLIDSNAPELLRFVSFMNSLETESHRGGVLICASMLEETLGQLIAAKLVDDAETKALLQRDLQRFATRIELAGALGLIDAVLRTELRLLKKIRNKFAHNIDITLADRDIISQCNQLTLALPDQAKSANDAYRKYWMSTSAAVFNMMRHLHSGKVVRL